MAGDVCDPSRDLCQYGTKCCPTCCGTPPPPDQFDLAYQCVLMSPGLVNCPLPL
jgi:hypothetical protein